ncbi:maltose/maltodextrin ABC transporter [Klebsiella pneumoniae]|uniref:Maltose/maltodextrin ABC transporter n=1 Tax=Klebsiella pneumoniae TaxID=573 RepID=A0A377TMT0_KLEPN|nr:maltose/maltodextrin ABC transporter [Klebsiella pneumoniae]
MAMVQPKSQKLRLFTTASPATDFIAAIMFPLLMVIAISLREGNFATGSLIPDTISWEHWRLALGFSVEHADGRVTPRRSRSCCGCGTRLRSPGSPRSVSSLSPPPAPTLRPYALPGERRPC